MSTNQSPPSSQRVETGSVNVPIAPWPPTAQDMDADVGSIADGITTSLGRALKDNDHDVGRLFLETGYWRDHLALSWAFRTLKGTAKISDFLGQHGSNLTDIKVDSSSTFRAPKITSFDFDDEIKGIQFYIAITTKLGAGRGVVRLAQDKGEWKIFTIFTTLEELRGHEEALGQRRPQGVQHGDHAARTNWQDNRNEEFEFQTSEPVVLIVGSGQAGLSLHARLKMLNVPTLVIDKAAAIGDNWQQRYHQLVLHDPVWFDHLPYLPFPQPWPVFTPKDKMAGFLAAYAALLELNVWTATRLASAVWEPSSATWTVQLTRTLPSGDHEHRILRPRHLVQATGHAGEPHLPAFPGLDTFGGRHWHSSAFPGVDAAATAVEGRPPPPPRRVVVVGACNSAHDIAHAYAEKGHAATLVQRSTTCVVSSEAIVRLGLAPDYSEGGPAVEDADVALWGTPAEVLKAKHVQLARAEAEHDGGVLDGLRAAGFGLDRGPDDAGLFFKYLQRGGGYYIDVGASRLVAEGRVAVRQGVGVAAVEAGGVRLGDGSVLPADDIVFATGYANMRGQTRAVFGDKVADRVGDIWGFDDEGEMRVIWRKTGHPGFWVHGGNLAFCRYYSRLLALQIKGLEEGMVKYEDMHPASKDVQTE